MQTPKPPKKVKAPESCANYLTFGKEYEVIKVMTFEAPFGYDFQIISDLGETTTCTENFCSCLMGLNWIIID